MPTENRSSNTEQMVSVPEGYMLVERSIWTEQQVEAAIACITRLKVVPGMRDRDLAMAAIDAAQCKAPNVTLTDLQPAARVDGLDCRECEGAQRLCWSCKTTAQHQGEPIMLAAVGELQEDGEGGLEVQWLLEGGTAELFHGTVLLVAENAPKLCEEDGSAEVYTHADAGEVERLREGIAKHWKVVCDQRAELDTLRAQLAAIAGWTTETRAAVLEAFQDELNESASYPWYDAAIADLMKLVEALPVSAEPSSPVERDQGITGTSFQRLNMLAKQGE